MNKILRRIILAIYIAGFIITNFLTLSVQAIWKYPTSKTFKLENAGFLILNFLILLFIFIINKKRGNEIEEFLRKHSKVLLGISLLFLLFWQLYTCYGAYFASGWDAEAIHDTVIYEVNQQYDNIYSWYYSWFPNNLLLVWLFKTVILGFKLLGIHNYDYCLVAFQCVIDVLTIWLTYFILRDLTNSRRAAWLGYIVAYLFIGMSPWFIVAYSDATGIIFPVLLIRLLQLFLREKQRWKRVFFLLLFGFIAMAGYYIKPQILIVLLSAIVIELLFLFTNRFKVKIFNFIKNILCCGLGMVICICLYTFLVVPSLHISIDPSMTTGWQHFFMMGLNDDTSGVYSQEDYNFTRSFSTNEERNEADITVAKERITNFGFKGMIRHICRKQLVNYGDGTFAWNVEGNSFAGDPKWADNASSKFIRSFIKPDGSNYDLFLSGKQMIWTGVLFFQLFACAYKRDDISQSSDTTIVLMITSIIGLTLFELLFEARARYLFCYAPVYVILATWGVCNAHRMLKRIH